MLILATCVGIGTVIESRYNADYARLLIYQAWWFYVLQALLGVNIFCATISRYPFKVHHTGFVITHIGLLTLLTGAFVTAKFGIDGQLVVSEDQKDNKVMLPDTVIEFKNITTGQKKVFEIPRDTVKKNINLAISDFLTAETYLPFSKTEDTYQEANEGAGAIKFSLKSPFFNVTQWLHGEDNPEIQMGPALFRLKNNKNLKQEPLLIVFDATTSKILTQKTLKQLRQGPFKINNVTISLVKAMQSATVDKNRISENKNGQPNPALELLLVSGKEKIREISYAKFPDFTLNGASPFNLKFHYIHESPLAEDHKGNVVDFELGTPLKVKLSKNKQIVEEKILALNETYQTPWMGIQITLLEAHTKSLKKTLVLPTGPIPRSPLPPPAVLFKFHFSDSNESIWLTHNQTQEFKLNDTVYSIYYGAKSIEMPFNLYLKKFEKVDYPGTQTPKSFKSTVLADGIKDDVVISMNEPLKHQGFTLYQASYILQDGTAPASVFSVNKDPGRPIKYLGSIILSLGIIIFTVMRSGFYKKLKKRPL